MIKRTARSSVREQQLGVPGMLFLTSERLLFGSVALFTVCSLPALRSVSSGEGLFGDACVLLPLT